MEDDDKLISADGDSDGSDDKAIDPDLLDEMDDAELEDDLEEEVDLIADEDDDDEDDEGYDLDGDDQ